MMSSGVEYLSR